MINTHIITSFKPFIGDDKLAQMSAIYSWEKNGIKFSSTSDLYGKRLYGVRNGYDIGYKNDADVIKDLILAGVECSESEVIVLINGDIIILPGFYKIINSMIGKYGINSFFTSTRYDINLAFEVCDEKTYNDACNLERRLYDTVSSSDIFIMSRENMRKMAEEMPDLIMGRYGWDNWIHYWAAANLPHYNCTNVLITLHCNHNHEHIENQEGFPGKKAPSSAHNLRLLEEMSNKYGSMIRINKWQKVEL